LKIQLIKDKYFLDKRWASLRSATTYDINW